MGKFSALPRGSIKRPFYSVNPFPVQAQVYRRGSHAAGKQQHRELKYSSRGQKWSSASRVAAPAPWAAASRGWCRGGGTRPSSSSPGCRHDGFLTQGLHQSAEQAPGHMGCAEGEAKGITGFLSSPTGE